MNKIIKIARAVRYYPGGIAEVTLVWRVSDSKFGVEYQEIDALGDMRNTVPDNYVSFWLSIFAQDHLQPDFYQLVDPPTETWRNVIEAILKQ